MESGWRLGSGDLLDKRYRIEESLGSGGSGRVYAAVDEAAGDDDPERVAIKIIGTSHAESRSALELEFSLLARMSHPNLVDALRIGEADGRTYLVEELVEGPTLAGARDSLEIGDYWLLAHQILEGLGHIHRRGWVHHDIKPANILLTPSRTSGGSAWTAKIADLGVASLSGSDPEGRVQGTVPFLSPERLVGKLADPRSDIWALGMTLLYCITGQLVIDTDSVDEAARALRARPLPALRDLASEAPAGLEVIIARMLGRDGRTRYRDGGEALAALRDEMGRAGIVAPALPIETVAQSPAFVGRDLAVASVLETLTRGHQRRPRIARVRGPEGSGRTRLLGEIALEVQLHGARAVFVPPGEGLRSWRSALARLGGDASVSDPDEVVDRLVEALSQSSAVLLVDDVDAGGTISAHLLDRLGPALAAIAPGFLSGAVVAHLEPSSWQPAEPAWFVDVHLEALDAAEIHQVIESVLGGDIAAPVLRALTRRSGGNPARLLDAIRGAVQRDALRQVAGVWELAGDGLPAIDEPGGELLSPLGEDDLELLVALAVLGPAGEPVSLVVSRQVADLSWERFSASVASLRNRDLIRLTTGGDHAGGELALSIAAVGRAALAITADDEVCRRHQRAWVALSRSPEASPASLARHALGAGLLERAVELTLAAIDAALSRGDYTAVVELTEDAITAAASPADQQTIRGARAKALVALSRPLEGASLAESILEVAPDNIGAATVMTQAALMAGDSNRARAGLERLRAVASPGPGHDLEMTALEVEVGRLHLRPAEVGALATAQLEAIDRLAAASDDSGALKAADVDRARGRALLAGGTGLVYGGVVSEGLEMLERAHALFARLDDDIYLAHVEGALAAAADLGGREDERQAHLERGLECAARAGADSAAARLLNIRGLSHLWRGRTSGAVEALSEAESRARRAGLYRLVSVVAGNLVVVYRRAGLYGRALSAGRRSRRVKDSLGDRAGLTVTLLNLGDVYFDVGDYRLAIAAGRRVIRAAREQGRRRFEVGGATTVALACAKAGDLEGAREQLAWVAINGEGLQHHAHLEVELARATLDVAARNLVDAGERLRDIAVEAERRDEPYFRAWACYERGVLLGDLGGDDLQAAVEVASACAARHHLWRARAQLGVMLSATGERDKAGAELARAREVLLEVLDDLEPRHRPTYLSTPARRALVAAIRAEAGFPEVTPVFSENPAAPTTLVDVPRAMVTLLEEIADKASG